MAARKQKPHAPPSETHKHLGKWRARAGLSQAEIGRRLGWDDATVHQYVKRGRGLSLDGLAALARLFGEEMNDASLHPADLLRDPEEVDKLKRAIETVDFVEGLTDAQRTSLVRLAHYGKPPNTYLA